MIFLSFVQKMVFCFVFFFYFVCITSQSGVKKIGLGQSLLDLWLGQNDQVSGNKIVIQVAAINDVKQFTECGKCALSMNILCLDVYEQNLQQSRYH